MTDVSFAIGGQNAEFLAALQGCRDAMNQSASAMKQGLAGLSGSLDSVTKQVSGGLGGALDDIKSKIGTAFQFTGIAAAYEGIEKLGSVLEGFGEKAKSLTTNSDVLGVSVEQFQAMQVAAEEAGTGTETLVRAGDKLVNTLNEARQGTGSAIEKMRDMGVTLEQINNPTFTLNDLFQVLHDRLTNAGTAQQTQNVLMKEFGARSVTMVEVLKQYEGSLEGVATGMDRINGVTGAQAAVVKRGAVAWGEFFQSISNGFFKATAAFLAFREENQRLNALPAAQAKLDPTGQPASQTVDPSVAVAKQAAAQKLQYEGQLAVGWDALSNQMISTDVKTAKASVEVAKAGTEQRLAAARAYAAAVNQLDGPNSDKAREANAALLVAEREYADQYKNVIRDLSQFEIDENAKIHDDDLKFKVKQEQDDARYAAEYKRQMQELSDFAIDLDTRVTAEAAKGKRELLALNDKSKKDLEAKWKDMANTFSSSMANALGSILDRSKTFGQAMKGVFSSMVDAILKTIIQIGVQWAETQIANLILGKTTAKGTAMASASAAGAAGVASWAAAPWPVDVGAPAFGAAMYAEAMGFAAASAAGGYDIPAGVNPVTQLHSKEMVLPQKYGDVIRDVAENGGGGAGGGDTHNWNVNTLDAKSFHAAVHSPAWQKSIASAMRQHVNRGGGR